MGRLHQPSVCLGPGTATAPPRWSRGAGYRPVSKLSEVLRGAAESVQAGRKPTVIIDEMDQAVTSHSWATEEAQSWQQLVNIERHLRIRGPLLVYHAYRHIPVVLREGTMLKSMLQVIVKDGRRWVIRREEEGFLHVPPTVLPYLAYGLRGFDIDVDVRRARAAPHGSGERVARQILAYLDGARPKPARPVSGRRRTGTRRPSAFVEDTELTLRDGTVQPGTP